MNYKKLWYFVLGLQVAFANDYDFPLDVVRKYVHNCDLQRRWAMSFIAPHLKNLRGDERILDIGCGEGKITADLSRFVPEGVVIGVDPCKSMLDWAKKQYSFLEYPNLFFQEGSFSLPGFLEPFDLIFSNCALQNCKDLYTAFKKLDKLLKPSGKLLICIPAFSNEVWEEARGNIQRQPRWKACFQNREAKTVLTVEEYIDLLEIVGLKVKRVEKIDTVDPFIDSIELKEFLQGTITSRLDEDMEDFYLLLIEEYIRLSPQSLHENSVIEFRLGRIEIEAEKNENQDTFCKPV